jgi:hypothetical protein
MPSDSKTEALRQRLDTLVKDANDAEAKAVVARHRVQATAADLERKVAAAKGLLPSSSSSSAAYDSALITNLHIQATAVPNVHQLVNILLDTTPSNYAIWRDLMLMDLIWSMAEPVFDSSLSIGGPNTGATMLNSEMATVINVNLLSIGGMAPASSCLRH